MAATEQAIYPALNEAECRSAGSMMLRRDIPSGATLASLPREEERNTAYRAPTARPPHLKESRTTTPLSAPTVKSLGCGVKFIDWSGSFPQKPRKASPRSSSSSVPGTSSSAPVTSSSAPVTSSSAPVTSSSVPVTTQQPRSGGSALRPDERMQLLKRISETIDRDVRPPLPGGYLQATSSLPDPQERCSWSHHSSPIASPQKSALKKSMSSFKNGATKQVRFNQVVEVKEYRQCVGVKLIENPQGDYPTHARLYSY